jgi:hypothetical protein
MSLRFSLTHSKPQGRPDASQHFPQAIRRWGNSLAVRLPADCLRQAQGHSPEALPQ